MKEKQIIKKISEFFFNKFIINFVPGSILLYYGINEFIDLNVISDSFTSLIFILSFSWTLGVILEMIFFKEKYNERIDHKDFETKKLHRLFIAKIGLAIVCCFLLAFFGYFLHFLLMLIRLIGDFKTNGLHKVLKWLTILILGFLFWKKNK